MVIIWRNSKMAKKENKYKGYDITTQVINTGTDYDKETGAVIKSKLSEV